LCLDDVQTPVPVEVGHAQAERAQGRVTLEDAVVDGEHAGAVIDEQPVRTVEGADDEVGVAVGLDVETDDDVVVPAGVRVGRPSLRGDVGVPAVAVVPEDVLRRPAPAVRAVIE
jgi:hypothetical protein